MGRSEIKEIKLALFEILDVSSLTPKLKCNCKKKKKEKNKKKNDRRCPFACSSINVCIDDDAMNVA